jgi:hypothetical protein
MFFFLRVLGIFAVSQTVVGQDLESGAQFFDMYRVLPIPYMDLLTSNSSDMACASVNGRELCTVIHYCPKEAYQCDYINEDGHSCGLEPPLCNCTAIWGEETCQCYVSTSVPYWISTYVQCGGQEDITTLEIETALEYCLEPTNDVCVRGSVAFDIVDNGTNGFFDVKWDCPNEQTSRSTSSCTCKALLNYVECSSCTVCGNGDAGIVALECNGFSMDCDRNIQINSTEYAAPNAAANQRGYWVLVLGAATFLASIFLFDPVA